MNMIEQEQIEVHVSTEWHRRGHLAQRAVGVAFSVLDMCHDSKTYKAMLSCRNKLHLTVLKCDFPIELNFV